MTGKLRVYDPVQCCSTGVCGPDADDEPAQFAASLEWLKGAGVDVERFNLGFQPGEFVTNDTVKSRLESDGVECLPMLIAGEEIIKVGGYMSRKDLAAAFQLDLPMDINSAKSSSGSGCCG
jgi:hypothetical protein